MSDELFPLAVLGAYIDRRSPNWDTDTKKALSGKRTTTTWALEPLVTYLVKTSVRSIAPQEYQELLSFAGRHFGGFDSFLLQDPEDNTASDPSVPGGGHCFGVGNGSTTSFQLQRRVLGATRDKLPGGPWRSSSAPRTNSLLWSQDFTNAAWTKGTGVLVAANAALAPDNTGASGISYSGAGSAGAARVSQALVAATAFSYCVSVWLRADAPVTVALGNAAGAVLSAVLSTSWQRFDFNVAPGIGGDVGLVIYSPAGVNTAFRIYAWGAQSEVDVAVAGTPTRLIQTTTAAFTVPPAFWTAFTDSFLPVYELNGPASIYRQDYQGVIQLLPWARTNACLQSQTFGNATWTKTSASVGAAVTAPDGTTSALPLTSSASSATVAQTVAGLVTGQQYTFSVWLKCVAGGTVQLSAAAGFSSVLTLTANWQRFSVTFTATGTSQLVAIGGNNSWANGQIIQAWGAQLEIGATATSYLPTTTVAVSLTDYTLPGLGAVVLAVAPLTGAVLSWLGSYLIRVRLDDSAQKGMDLQRIVQAMWSTGLQLISVIP